jgi:uncharacterized protein (TIGR00303 family)
VEYRIHIGSIDELIARINEGFTFVLTIGTTDTSLIPGITIAGASPELTHYTPAADAEYLLLGRCRVIQGIPATPDGKPTPALLTRAALSLTDPQVVVANAGARVRPRIPYVDLHGEPGNDIRTGSAIPRDVVDEVLSNGIILGRSLGRRKGILVVGESIPAGTTTAMSLLVAMGYDAWGKVSSASPVNPVELKVRVVKEALGTAGIQGPLRDPLEAVSKVGDPVTLGVASIALGALDKGAQVVLAGGTQMAAVLALMKALRHGPINGVTIATTRWVLEDPTADLLGLVGDIDAGVGVVSVNLDLSDAPYPGLRAYEEGFVKEGVGAGGACLMALLAGHSTGQLRDRMIDEYEAMMRMR